ASSASGVLQSLDVPDDIVEKALDVSAQGRRVIRVGHTPDGRQEGSASLTLAPSSVLHAVWIGQFVQPQLVEQVSICSLTEQDAPIVNVGGVHGPVTFRQR